MSSRTARLVVLVAYEIALMSTMSSILCALPMLVVLMRIVVRILLVHVHLISKSSITAAIHHAMRVEARMVLRVVHAVMRI